ncbi:protein kinase [Streptomyces sp. NPDC005648]|uniref:serine/threonine-protein kinase n=1 Tax=Streptomyces sp. NPDC005648 TaxID=3157044 RepID=UPI0033AFB863
MTSGESSGGNNQGDGTGRLLAGRYRVVAQLGRGGMGVVWRAVDEVLGREVAVKELRTYSDADGPELADLRLRMQREARAAARVRHPGVVAVHDVTEVDGRPLIVMELVDGPSLDAVLRERTLGPHEAAGMGAQVMEALAAAHRAGVLHRDVKPGNILLERSGRVLLTDFGIAAMEDPGDGADTHLTRSGALVGSLDYLAPERAQGADASPASDVWALGATLYAAVEGTSPFRRTSTYSTLTAIVTEPLTEPEHAGPLAPVLRRLLDKRPETRPAAEQARALLQAVADAGDTDTPTTTLRGGEAPRTQRTGPPLPTDFLLPKPVTPAERGTAPTTPQLSPETQQGQHPHPGQETGPGGQQGQETGPGGRQALAGQGAGSGGQWGQAGQGAGSGGQQGQSGALGRETGPGGQQGQAAQWAVAGEAPSQAAHGSDSGQPTTPPGPGFGPTQKSASAAPGSGPAQTPESGAPGFGSGQSTESGVPGFGSGQSAAPGFGPTRSAESGAPGSGPPQSAESAAPGFGPGQSVGPVGPGFGSAQTSASAAPGFGGAQTSASAAPGFGPAVSHGSVPELASAPTGAISASASPRRKGRVLLAAAAVTVVLAAGGGTAALLHSGNTSADAGPSSTRTSAQASASESDRTDADHSGGAKPTEHGDKKPPAPKATADGKGSATPTDGAPTSAPTKSSGGGTTGGGGTGGTGGTSAGGTNGGGSGGTTGGGSETSAAPACTSIGGGKYNCTVWRTAKSYTASGTEAGILNAGTNYFYCQQNLGRRETYGQWTNVWWARTDDDSGNTNVYVSDVYIRGGNNDEPVPGLPVC